MGRPRTITDEALLDAAREVFLRDGVQASTAEVARHAGVSEGLIFKRFATKEELFRACFDVEKFGMGDLQALAGKNELRTNLVAIIGDQVSLYRKVLPCVVMRMTHGGLVPRTLFEGQTEPPPVRNIRRIAAYFEAEMELGRMRRADTLAIARLVVGSTHNLVFFELAGLAELLPTNDADFAESLATVILDGVRAPASTPGARTPRVPRKPPRMDVTDAS